jgi:hypothetical protein
MARHRLRADLQPVRALIVDGLDQLDRDSGPHTRKRLQLADEALVRATYGLSRTTRTALYAVVEIPSVWAAASAARALGLAAGWVIVIATVTILGVGLAAEKAVARIPRLRDRHHPRPRESRVRVFRSEPPTRVPEPLVRARDQLVSAALRQAGINTPLPYLTELATRDQRLAELAYADLLLCQAIDLLRREPA